MPDNSQAIASLPPRFKRAISFVGTEGNHASQTYSQVCIVQSSNTKPGTRAKSRWLRVTRIEFSVSTIAAIRKSCVPMRIL